MKFIRSRYVIIGLVTFILGLVVMFPARVAYHWFAPSGVAFSGISGSIWSGRASAANVAGVYLRNIGWRIRPTTLLTGKLGYAIEADGASGFASGVVALGIGGSAELTELTASLPLQTLQQVVGVPGLDGTVSLQFERLELADGIPVAADGNLQVANLRVPLIHRSSLGGFKAEFFTQESGVMASVEDTDAVVDVAGSLSLASDRTYQFIALVAPKQSTPDDLRRQMGFLGTPNERGQHELRLEGQL
ncbi:MAG: type II secretion system protein N [Woeseiaceae bacterium]